MAYNNEQIRQMFQSQFNVSTWTEFIINFFKAQTFNQVPEVLDINPEEGSGYYWGDLLTKDDTLISFFYFKMKKRIDRRKVGLANLIKKYIKGVADVGIGVFDDGNHWRLSFITDMRGEKTSPKRFTFVFGDPENHYLTPVTRFMELQRKGINYENIKDAFSVEALTKQFYNDLFDWYTWALDPTSGVYFPNNPNTTEDDRDKLDTKMIRLITRLMFVWFIKQKDLVPDDLFNPERLEHILIDFDPQSMKSSNYYQAILQNLFFATLNRPIKTITYNKDGNEQIERRCFAKLKDKPDVKSKYRYEEMFKISEDKILSLFEFIPFINGGLFECLDKNKTSDGVEQAYFHDGFSRNDTVVGGHYTKRAFIPNKLFFDPENGIISIFRRYNFTVEENSPSEQLVALDPELLGKVFENLLGVYNPETKETARNQSGSFYTPREIVNYMVDISLQAYLGDADDVKALFADEFEYDESKKPFYDEVIAKLKAIKVLDPACGSGAFPMGMLNRIVEILQNLHATGRKFDLKLAIMENCIYGSDIQAIAAQITKLRFFISLVCDCVKNSNPDDNFGIPNLPNLETHFVTADSLIALKKPQQYGLFEQDVIELQKKLQLVRHEHFMAKTMYQKAKLRVRDKQLREELIEMLKSDNVIASENAYQMAKWNPYDQNGKASFFDSEWMFGINDGFNIVIGNPPYIPLQKNNGKLAKLYKPYNFKSFAGRGDIYCLFYEFGVNMLSRRGVLCYITSDKWMCSGYGKKLKQFFINNVYIEKLLDFAGMQLFDNVTVETNIALIRNFISSNPTKCVLLTKSIKKEQFHSLSSYVNNHSVPMTFNGTDSWSILSSEALSLQYKINNSGPTLKEQGISVNFGQKTGLNDAFIITSSVRSEILSQCKTSDELERTKSLIKPVLRGRDIKEYYSPLTTNYIILAYNGLYKIINEQYPTLYNYLKNFEEDLKKRGQCTDNIDYYQSPTKEYPGQHHWLELDNNPTLDKLNEYSEEKIIWKRVGSLLRFSYSPNFVVSLDSTCYAIGNNIKYLCCVLNSKIGHYILSKTAPRTGTGDLLISVQAINPMRVPIPSMIYKNELERLLEIQSVKYSDSTQAKIDILVYLLYGLTYDEVKVVENTFPIEKRLNLDKLTYTKWFKEKDVAFPNERELEQMVR